MIFRKIANQFKRPSGFLGKIVARLMIKGNTNEYQILLKHLNLRQNDKILEIGYGPGVGIEMIAKQFDSCEIVGIDFSELMYKQAKVRNQKYIENGNVDLMFGDFIDNEFNSSDFDIVYCLNVVYFWEDLQKPFEKIKAILKQGGTFGFYMAKSEDLVKLKFTKEDVFNKYPIDHVVDVLKSVGFQSIDYFFDKGYYIMAKK